jgi:DNA-binding NarL/FixJ family response regulator
MGGGTLLVSRAVNWFPHFKMRLEALGFPDVHVTCKEKDGLNMLINELKPQYVLIGSNFYDCGTPYMIGQLLSVFPDLNIAVINTSPFPDAIAAWFIFHGINFYVKLLDGKDEFHRGLQCILNRRKYIAPDVQAIIDGLGGMPDVPLKATKRQKEILLMLCCGFTIKRIEDRLHVCKATVENHIRELMNIFNSRGREELIKTVNELEIFTKNEMRFYDDGDKNVTLPEWAATQIAINKYQLSINKGRREQVIANS